MDFWLDDQIICANVKFNRIGTRKEYKEIRSKITKERRHYQTGLMTIEIPAHINTIEEAKKYAMDLIDKFDLVLSFAHKHDVPIHELLIYEVEKGKEIKRSREIHSIRMGKAGAICHNLHYGLEKFLNSAIPLLNDANFVSDTNIRNAMLWYNYSQDFNLIDIRFQCLWLALELMSNTYYERNPKDLVLNRTEWKTFKVRCKKFLKDIGKEKVFNDLLANISFLRQGTIKERIYYLLKDDKYKMERYYPEVQFIYDNMRVPIFHGKGIDWNAAFNPFEKVYKLERLLEKLIFKTLSFYDNDMIHYRIKDDDLSKR